MANFLEHFTSSTGNFFFGTVSGYSISRFWYIQDDLLKPEDMVSNEPGFILVNTLPELNGTLEIKEVGLDVYNGCDNSVIVRYQGPTNFHGFRFNPGLLDQKGVYFTTNNTNEWQGQLQAISEGDIKLNLINSVGTPLSAETYPKTELPSGGIIRIFITDNDTYTLNWYTSALDFVASAVQVDNTYTASAGAIGFYHSEKWDANITGWDYIKWTDGSSATAPPTIQYFSASDTIISNGDSTDLNWEVTSGTDTTTIWVDNSIGVLGELAGSSAVSPIVDTTYVISAWNVNGSVSADTIIHVVSAAPTIFVFSAVTPISANGDSTLTWETSASTSAFIDQGIGQIEPVSAGIYIVSGLTNTTSYNLSAYDDEGNYVTEGVTVEVLGEPYIVIDSFSASSNPACSGIDYVISWETSGVTSAFIDNGVGYIDTSALGIGSYTTSSDLPATYTMSAWNAVGGITSSSYIQQIYYRDPVADAGSNASLTATGISGVSTTFDAVGSYDPDGQSIASYQWTSGTVVVSTSQAYSPILSAGQHLFNLVVTDGCGQSGTDSVSATVVNMIPPIAIASASPLIVNASATFNLDGSNSYGQDGTITNYLWELSGTTISTTVSADTFQNEMDDYTYTLTVTDTSGLSASDTITVHVNGLYAPSADAGDDQSNCLASGDTIDIFLDGSGSLDSTSGGIITWYEWDLSAFGIANVSANIVIDKDEIFTIVSNVSATGVYNVGLVISAADGVINRDSTVVTVLQQPIASAGIDQEYTLDCNNQYYNVTLSGQSDISGGTYVWYFENGTVTETGQVITREYTPGTFSAGLEVSTSADGVVCTSEQDSITITINSNPLLINTFEFDPSFINGTSAYAWTTLEWEMSSATVSAAIDNGVGYIDTSALSAGSIEVSGTDDLTYTISAFDVGGCMITSQAIVTINLGNISACVLKRNYISLFGPEHIRWGDCRDINLINMLPTNLIGTDTETYLELYQDYLNEMYDGACGWTLSTSALSTTACDISACSVSAVDNWYEHQTYTGSAGISTNVLNTPTNDVEKLFVDNFCQIPKEKISVLEKTYRLTELFDPDLIPIELIQFYAQNLGYEVGLSRDNIGLDFDGTQVSTQEAINQKKYLRFMIRNLPTWYKIKTTRNSVKMMLYSFGLVGDFIYYFTKNYLDSKSGNGLNTLGYGGQNVNSYGVDGTSAFNKYIVNDQMTYKELQKIKCDLAQWEEFKNNKRAYFNMLNDLQASGQGDWVLTDVNPISVQEDISNIPDNFFSTPHFRLWFDILESMSSGNFSTDLHKQKLITEAINAIKPINTVFEGITGVFRTVTNLYIQPYSRIRKHISLISDGYADWYK